MTYPNSSGNIVEQNINADLEVIHIFLKYFILEGVMAPNMKIFKFIKYVSLSVMYFRMNPQIILDTDIAIFFWVRKMVPNMNIYGYMKYLLSTLCQLWPG